MSTSLFSSLEKTTIQSSTLTHTRLKAIASKFGCTEDIISRMAIGYSLKHGKCPLDFKASRIQGDDPQEMLVGKSLRGTTLFKQDLALWVALLANVETEIESDDVRQSFINHWERGIEQLFVITDERDWLKITQSLSE